MLGVERASGARGSRLDPLAGGPRLLWGELCSQPPVGDPAGALERLWSTPAEPHLERVLHGPRGGGQLAERQALGAVVDGLHPTPPPHQTQGLLERGAPGDPIEAECLRLEQGHPTR